MLHIVFTEEKRKCVGIKIEVFHKNKQQTKCVGIKIEK